MKRGVRQPPDVCVVGAGLIGLSLALELEARGAHVVVLERDTALAHASTAAAGMLAAEDPDNPPELSALAALSVRLYPEFLARIEALSGMAVPFQTCETMQLHDSYGEAQRSSPLPQMSGCTSPFRMLAEHSIDPRQLAAALVAAVRRTTIELREHTSLQADPATGVLASEGAPPVERLVDARGGWSVAPVVPRKGQMLSVALPAELGLAAVVRTAEVYVVPRMQGPRAGTAVVGATVEDAGFDTRTHAVDLARLRALAASLLPMLGDERLCPMVDQWAGLRPATPDRLPLLGAHPWAEDQMIATGHYRNGILLAPATARVMAQLLCGEQPETELEPFAPERFLRAPAIPEVQRYSRVLP